MCFPRVFVECISEFICRHHSTPSHRRFLCSYSFFLPHLVSHQKKTDSLDVNTQQTGLLCSCFVTRLYVFYTTNTHYAFSPFPLFSVPLKVVTCSTQGLFPLLSRVDVICAFYTFVLQVAHVRPKYPMPKLGHVPYSVISSPRW